MIDEIEAQKKNPKVNLTDGYHKEIWRKCMKQIYKIFNEKTEEQRNDFANNEIRRLKENTKPDELLELKQMLKEKNKEELFWWFAANDASFTYLVLGRT